MKRMILLLPVLLMTGCLFKKYEAAEEKVIRNADFSYMLTFAIDTSAEFTDSQWNDPAFRFFLGTVERYFQDRAEPTDRVLLTNLGDEKNPLLWKGTPRQLMRKFGNAEAMKAYLQDNAAPANRPFGALATTLKYVSSIPQAQNGKTVVVVLSSMRDESETKEEDMASLSESLKRFSTVNGEIGFWWIDMGVTGDIQQCFRDAGLPEPQTEIMEEEPEPLRFE